MWHLPDELLVEILACLDGKSLKAARLVCQRWGEASAHSLYHRIYFAPRENVMAAFKEITSNPLFANNITEIVYDARLFWAYMAHHSVYDIAHSCGFPNRYPDLDGAFDQFFSPDGNYRFTHVGISSRIPEYRDKRVEESHLRYKAELQKQNSIMASAHDLDDLRFGTQRLFKLNQITVIDRFEHPLDYEPFSLIDHEWYRSWSAKQFEGTAGPSR